MPPSVSTPVPLSSAIRLGWCLAEVRGRNWWQGPRPTTTLLPADPRHALPLRSELPASVARQNSVDLLTARARELGVDDAGRFSVTLLEVLPSFDEAGELTLTDAHPAAAEAQWQRIATLMSRWDVHIQRELALVDDLLANAYLLGRGLAESYWALGPDTLWGRPDAPSAVSLTFLLGAPRRRELTRMLGRVGPALGHPLTAAAIAGSLEAWGAVASDPAWAGTEQMRSQLHAQIRRWYELVVLEQDPTTLLRPYAMLRGGRNLERAVLAFWPQLVLSAIAVGLVAAFLALAGGSAPDWVKSLLASGGVSVFVVAGVMAKAKSAATQLLTRLRQDAYTDLVAVNVAIVPNHPAVGGKSSRRTKRQIADIVHERLLTVATPLTSDEPLDRT